MLFSDASGPTCTLAAVERDYPEWRRGRERYTLWAIPVTCPLILQRMQAARDLLGDWLHPNTLRQAHITLFVCGFEASNRVHDDDFTHAQLKAQQSALNSLGSDAFELHIGGLESFSSAAFLRVTDPGNQLPALRQQLAQQNAEIRYEKYVAHVTVGLYRQRIGVDQWRQRTASRIDDVPLPLSVHAIDYCSYEATQMQGPLKRCRRVRLPGATLNSPISAGAKRRL